MEGVKFRMARHPRDISTPMVVIHLLCQFPQRSVSAVSRGWMELCGKQHHECRIPPQTPVTAPCIRLIDVPQQRVIPAMLAQDFVALSYIDGQTSRPGLTSSTLEKCSSLSELDGLDTPLTISDTIQLVRDIGKRYRWVDSVYIV